MQSFVAADQTVYIRTSGVPHNRTICAPGRSLYGCQKWPGSGSG